MIILRGILGFLMVFLLTGCISDDNYKLLQTEHVVENKNISDSSIEYKILPQDRLDVIIYKDPNQEVTMDISELGQHLSTKGVLVDTAGNIRLPLLGKVKVAGLSQTQAADKLTSLYKKYLKTPSVYLEVLNKHVFILGEVNKPGVVTLNKEKMTLFEALAYVGDLKDSAERDNIIILSNTNHGMQMRKVDLTHFDTMNYAKLMLRPNDIVYVQPDNWKEFRVASDNFTAPFETITKIAAPFVTLKYLSN